MPDVGQALEFAKLFGFPSLCLAVMTYLIWKAVSWFGREIIKPTADDIRAVIRAAGPAAVRIRDDVAEVKETTSRLEKKQSEHFEICAGMMKPPAKGRTAPA